MYGIRIRMGANKHTISVDGQTYNCNRMTAGDYRKTTKALRDLYGE